MVQYLGRRNAGLSVKELGQAAGGLDYTAISIAISRFARRLTSNPALGQACADCQEELAKCINVEM